MQRSVAHRVRDIATLREGAANWVVANRAFFVLPREGESDLLVTRLKPLSELGLTLETLTRTKRHRGWSAELHRITDNMTGHLLAQVGSGDKLTTVLREQPDLIALASFYASILSLGFANREFDILVRHLAGTNWMPALELPPWRGLDVARSFKTLRVASPLRRKELFSRTWLGRLPEPWLLSDNAAYSVTHTAFYMTDFGRHPEGMARRFHQYLAQWLPAWCGAYALRKNYDLLGELLMVAECLDRPTPLGRFWDELVRSQRPSGVVPGPPMFTPEIDLKVISTKHRSRVRHYHTTLVAILAASLGLMYGRSLARC